LLRVAVDVARTPGAATVLRAALTEHDLALDDGEVGRSVAAALRTALAIICARLLRDESRAAETLAYRDRLYALDGLLQTVLAPRRRGQYATFPSRRHMREFEQMGFPVEEVARVIGMPPMKRRRTSRSSGCVGCARVTCSWTGLQAISTWWPTMASSP
jgi:hypothetical protein